MAEKSKSKKHDCYAILMQIVRKYGGTVHLIEKTGVYLIFVPDEVKTDLDHELQDNLGRFYNDLCAFSI